MQAAQIPFEFLKKLSFQMAHSLNSKAIQMPHYWFILGDQREQKLRPGKGGGYSLQPTLGRDEWLRV